MSIEEIMEQAKKDGDLQIVGDVILVSRMPEREAKTKGGIVMASSMLTGHKQMTGFDSNPPMFVKVVAVGAGYYDEETGKDVPLDVTVGNVIEVGQNSVVFFSSFGNIVDDKKNTGIGISRANEIRLKFKDEAAYNKFMGFL